MVREGARLAASYIAAGFVHGVLNTDNIAITCPSFDYGPWRWTPYWDGAFTAAYFDHLGLYAFARQPEALHWNLVQLASSLTAIAEVQVLTPPLERFPQLFQTAMRDTMFARLGIVAGELERDAPLLGAMERALATKTVQIDRFFFDWRGGARRGASPADALYEADPFADFRKLIGDFEAAATTSHPYWSQPEPCSMHIHEVEAIWARIDEADDWSALERKINEVRLMGEAMGPQA